MKSILIKPYLVLIILIILIIAGFYSGAHLPADIFPNLNYPLLNIITHYPGGSPEAIETLITRPIEIQISTILNVRRISSLSRQGLSQISVEFNWGMDVGDARQLINQELSKIIPDLPAGVIPVIENIGSTLQEIMNIGVTIKKNSINLSELKYLIKTKIVNYLKSIKGIARIEVIGGQDEAFIVRPIFSNLIKNNLSLSELRQVIKSNNVHLLAGYTEKAYQDYAIRGLGNIENIEELKNITVKTAHGLPILLKNIATIEKGALPQRYTIHVNGSESIAMSIFKHVNANTLGVSKEVDQKLARIKNILPHGVNFIKLYDQSEIVRETSKNLKTNIFVSIVLIIVVLFLFLGNFRNSIIVALSIPIVFIISFIFINLSDFSLNMITLGAMAVAAGLIVDDSIIVLESIQRHKLIEKNPVKAVINGTREIISADISGSLTTVAAFIPFVFLIGLGGRFASPFGWVMIIVLILSLIISLTFIPVWLSMKKEDKKHLYIAANVVNNFIAFNQKIITLFLKKKKAVLWSVFGTLIISGGLLLLSPINFLPPVDEGAMLMEYILPPGTSLKESDRVGKIIEDIILDNPDVATVFRRTGSETGSYHVEPVNAGELLIKLKPKFLRKKDIFQVIKDLKKSTDTIPGIISFYAQITVEKMEESFSGLPTIFGINIYGEDYSKLIKYADQVENIAKKTPGVGIVINNTKYKVPELLVRPIPEKMLRYGLSSKEVVEELKLHQGGEIVSRVLKEEKLIPIFIQGEFFQKNFNKAIKEIPIKLPQGGYAPLSHLTNISSHWGANSISHINLQRVITLPLEVEGSISSISKHIKDEIKKLNLPKGYFIDFGGQYKYFIDMGKVFILFSIISILIVYMIMYIQFGNLIHPLAIMFELPFSFIGAFLAIAIFRQPLNISFFIGLVTLIGISVNNGIVLIDYINKKRKEGLKRKEAIVEATRIRTRPIFLTALTSILALLPISLGIGLGSKMHQSLAICVMGGLLVNTVLTLNVLPLLYCTLEDLFKKKNNT